MGECVFTRVFLKIGLRALFFSFARIDGNVNFVEESN